MTRRTRQLARSTHFGLGRYNCPGVSGMTQPNGVPPAIKATTVDRCDYFREGFPPLALTSPRCRTCMRRARPTDNAGAGVGSRRRATENGNGNVATWHQRAGRCSWDRDGVVHADRRCGCPRATNTENAAHRQRRVRIERRRVEPAALGAANSGRATHRLLCSIAETVRSRASLAQVDRLRTRPVPEDRSGIPAAGGSRQGARYEVSSAPTGEPW